MMNQWKKNQESYTEVGKMAELIFTTNIKREQGYLYFCGTSKDGFLTINKAKMNRKGGSKPKKR